MKCTQIAAPRSEDHESRNPNERGGGVEMRPALSFRTQPCGTDETQAAHCSENLKRAIQAYVCCRRAPRELRTNRDL